MRDGSLVNKKIREVLGKEGADGPFVLAVSGGADSQCLLKAFPHVLGKDKDRCIAVGVDHGLRLGAAGELDLASDLADKEVVSFFRVKLQVAPGANLMARAREARYAALTSVADSIGAKYVVTAHHADDRAETVLIRLIRGKGVGSLGVLPAVSGRILRPMLTITRRDTEAYLARWGIPYAIDPSNSNDRFLRTRVRHELMPLLAELNPSIRERLLSLADEALEVRDSSSDG